MPDDLKCSNSNLGWLFTLQGQDQTPAAPVITVFAQIYTLPGSQIQFPISDRDRDTGAQQTGLDVRRHIVRAFVDVSIKRIVFRYQSIEPMFQIALGTRISIFLN